MQRQLQSHQLVLLMNIPLLMLLSAGREGIGAAMPSVNGLDG
jgi:hypothetical protein